MRDRKLATRYARALLSSLSEEQAVLADSFLVGIGEALEESAEFRDLLQDPAISRRVRESVLRSLAEQAAMPPQMGNFLATIVDHNRSTSLASIATVFHELHEQARGVVHAEITTATPLSDDLRDQTLRTLEQITGSKIRLAASVEPDLLGGAVTRIGSRVYDGSLRTQLEELRRRMVQE